MHHQVCCVVSNHMGRCETYLERSRERQGWLAVKETEQIPQPVGHSVKEHPQVDRGVHLATGWWTAPSPSNGLRRKIEIRPTNPAEMLLPGVGLHAIACGRGTETLAHFACLATIIFFCPPCVFAGANVWLCFHTHHLQTRPNNYKWATKRLLEPLNKHGR